MAWMKADKILALILVSATSLSTALAQVSSKPAPRRETFGSSLKQAPSILEKQPDAQTTSKESSDASLAIETIRIDTTLVVNDVLVTDASGTRPILGLNKDDFVVVEDNVPQQVATFTAGNDAQHLPRSIVLIVDRSISQVAYLEQSMAAAGKLIDQLAPTDQVAIVDDSVKLWIDFTNNKGKLKSTLKAIGKYARDGFPSSSLQFSALLATLRELIDTNKVRPIIIFQTDGDEASLLNTISRSGKKILAIPYGMDDIYKEVERSRVEIYSVIPSDRLIGIPGDELMSRGRELLKKEARTWNEKYNKYGPGAKLREPGSDNAIEFSIQTFAQGQMAATHVAEISGGWAEFLEQPEQAAGIYARILSDINSRYIIGYYPTNKSQDGQLRRVRIEVRGHPEYSVHGRQSYYATSH
ncbi:MAG: Ca-activated chloride channel [Acidobacteriota bacterium]|jgi:VWFA-related protein|nr:Ca-activated chloride channel [Acidobacteriota bacterium]